MDPLEKEDACGQPERDARLLEGVTNPAIVYYGPHLCDLGCEQLIVCGSKAQGHGDLRFDYPAGPVYPNHNWTAHRCNHSNPCPKCGRTQIHKVCLEDRIK